MAAKAGASRRRHSEELKAEVVDECMRPGASVAAISLARGLNANLVHHWLRTAKAARNDVTVNEGAGEQGFIELQLPKPVPTMELQVIQTSPNCGESWRLWLQTVDLDAVRALLIQGLASAAALGSSSP